MYQFLVDLPIEASRPIAEFVSAKKKQNDNQTLMFLTLFYWETSCYILNS